MKQKVKPKKQHIMKTHIIYSYNGKDIESYGKTIESNSVTGLICEAIEYVELILSKIDKYRTNDYYTHQPHSSMIIYSCESIDKHGQLHRFDFTIKSSPAIRRKAINHFEDLGIFSI